MPNTQGRVVNPAAADVLYTNAGVAYDSQSDMTAQQPAVQPTLAGRAKGLYSNRTLLNVVGHGITCAVFGSTVVGGPNVGYAAWSASAESATVAAASGYAKYTDNAHGLSVGDIVNVTDTNDVVGGPQRITAADTNTFTTNKAYTSGAGTVTYYTSSGTQFASMTAEKYVIRRVSDELAGGVSNTTLRSGGSDYQIRRSIQKLEHMYTTRVATAIRAGYWNEYSGAWSTDPTTADDASTFGTDDAAADNRTAPGELVYKEPTPVPVMDDYQARTG